MQGRRSTASCHQSVSFRFSITTLWWLTNTKMQHASAGTYVLVTQPTHHSWSHLAAACLIEMPFARCWAAVQGLHQCQLRHGFTCTCKPSSTAFPKNWGKRSESDASEKETRKQQLMPHQNHKNRHGSTHQSSNILLADLMARLASVATQQQLCRGIQHHTES